jgi:hypothetical protein
MGISAAATVAGSPAAGSAARRRFQGHHTLADAGAHHQSADERRQDHEGRANGDISPNVA